MPDSPLSNGPAVFLSYAREDGAAVQRIADALRAFGVEVWFDQNELRGGDTWDQKIRSQIRTCTLFVAIVSAQTEARSEGYFRREWRLAVDRTHDMAANRAFIVPVVIDDTRESGAAVPEEFMRYQWTRLNQGVPTADFITQIQRLLEAPTKPAPAIPVALLTFAIAQMGVHLVFFLHLTSGPDNTNNIMALAFGVLIVFLLFGGSVWIMHHMNTNMMMPAEGGAPMPMQHQGGGHH